MKNELIKDIHKDGQPVVLLNDIGLSEVSFVGIDNRKAAFKAVKYLLEKGHSRILFLSGPEHSINAAERVKGYKQALEEAGTGWYSEDVIPTGSTIEEGYTVGKRVFSQPKPYTAALCFNDMVAVGLSNALVEYDIKVPDDVSIVGFDNIKFCNSMRVPLTSVEVPAFKIGKTAAEVLFNSFDASSEVQQRHVIEAKLVERASVKSRV